MLVMDGEGKIFDERRKNQYNSILKGKRRVKERRIKDINAPKKIVGILNIK